MAQNVTLTSRPASAANLSTLISAVDSGLLTKLTIPDILGKRNYILSAAVGDGVADDTAAIQAAIDAAEAAGGGTVYLPIGVYKITSTLTINASNVALVGIGKRHLFSGGLLSGAYLRWAGGASPMLQVFAVSGASNIPIGNCGVSGLTLDCQHLATYGLDILSCRESQFDNLQILYPVTSGVHVSTVATLSVATDSQENIFEGVLLYVDGTADGIDLGSDHAGGGNTSLNTFRAIRITYVNGLGISLGDCDGNDFHGIHMNRASGTGVGIKFFGGGTSNVGHARYNSFYGVQPGAGGVLAKNNTQPSGPNSMFGYSVDNSSTLPTVETGGHLTVVMTDGRIFQDGQLTVTPNYSGYKQEEDFDGQGSANLQVGVLGWSMPTGTWSQIAGVASHPGIGRLTATAGVYGVVHMRGSPTVGIYLPADYFDVVFILKPTQTDSDTVFRFGLGSSAATDPPADGIYFEKLGGDTGLFGVCRASSSENRTASLMTVNTNWLRARIRRIDGNTVGFTVNANTEVNLALTVPTAALIPFIAVGATSASKTIDADYFSISIHNLNRQ